MDLGLKGKRALVMGGTSGLGLAIARALGAEGADVVVASRDEAKIAAAVKEIKSVSPGNVEGKRLDVKDEASVRQAVEQVLADGAIDILVNNTGGPAAGNPMDISLKDWDQGYASLLRSVILLSHLVVPGMKARGWGRILTVTSTSAKEIIPKLPVSSTFRAGMTAWTKEMAKEIGRSGILINNLLPGPTNTGRLKELEKKSPAFYQSMSTESALGRIAEPEEIGRVAAFLCSNANTFMTGTDVLVDGGYTKAL